MTRALEGKVALVAGATRGAGRGIALELGLAGAVVYCTGRSSRAQSRPRGPAPAPFDLARRPETIEETAELVRATGDIAYLTAAFMRQSGAFRLHPALERTPRFI